MIEWAIQRPGPPQKRYFETVNQQEGFVCHSAEAGLASLFATLDSKRPASWHFSLAKDGTLYQHYKLTASCWASGSFEANSRYIAMESEGFAGEPLTSAQEATALRLWYELGFTERGVNLWQHSEVATKWFPNAGPTACPSHRYDGAFAQLEDDMTPEERAKLNAVYAALCAGDQSQLDSWNANGNSLLLGFTLEQAKLAEHIGAHDIPPGTKFVAEVKP